ncbi:ROK family transcriptional regulator [Glaciihabitans sp. UYNi722]|uniref:ROK family transcriptional regulator n=1 Tax=Glaciihabitans sp. UYNi722 TaxID=3156344 RepID=UPI0033956429
MMQRGSNLPLVADYNQVLVVDSIRRHSKLSRVELADQTGLSSQTVSNICRRLVEQGLIQESGRVTGALGKLRSVYQINPSSRCAIGLHIDPARTVVALVDLSGQVMDRESLVNPTTDNPAELIDAIVSHVRTLVDRHDWSRRRLSGLGVASPGPLGMDEGTVIGPPNLRGWTRVRLREQLEERLGMQVILEKDTVAAATGELWVDNLTSKNFAFIYLGAGAGAGIVLDGEVMHGASGNLGNFGHLSGDPDGPLCYCGGRGCLAVTVMPSVLVERGQNAGVLGALNIDSPVEVETAIAELCRKADEGLAAAKAIVDSAAQSFARAAANLTNMLDLDTIIFGGPNWRSFSPTFMQVVPPIIDKLHIFGSVHGVTVRGTALGEDAGPIGAASLVLASAVSAHPSRLVLPI